MKAVGQGGGWEYAVGFTGDVELGVIRIAMKMNVVFPEDVTKGEKIDQKKHGAKNRTLRNTRSDREGMRDEGLQLNKLGAVGKVGTEPGEGNTSDANDGKSVHKDRV